MSPEELAAIRERDAQPARTRPFVTASERDREATQAGNDRRALLAHVERLAREVADLREQLQRVREAPDHG